MKKTHLFIFMSILIILFSILSFQIITINKQYNALQNSISKTSENLSNNFSNIDCPSRVDALENSINNLQNEINILKSENTFESYDSLFNVLEQDIKNLKQKYNTLLNCSNTINALKEKIDILENIYLTTQSDNNNSRIVGKWKTDVISFNPSVNKIEEINFTTIYEFKDNGDFYINDENVGIYFDNCIFFKDSNDKSFRVGHYYDIDNNLYIDLFFNGRDIVSDFYFYKCEKN